MLELQICRICLNSNVRLHRLTGSKVQDVYEKLTNKVQEVGNLYFACYICYCQLKNCQQLVTKSQRSEDLLKQILPISSELHRRPISFLDRLTHGLSHSLTVTNVQSLKIPAHNKFIKTEKLYESDTIEEIVKDGSDVKFGKGALSLKKVKLGDNQNIKYGDVNSIDSGKKENIFKIETNTAPYSNNLSRIVNNEKSKQVLVKETFICNDCGKTCETKAILIKHINGHKPVSTEPNGKTVKQCKYLCEKKYKSKITENDTSNKKFPYKCKHCNYRCLTSGQLKRHARTHTGEKPFKCQYCSYTCTYNCNLKDHIRIHTGETPFKCQYCSYSCKQKSNLKKHSRTHTGEKPFKCQYCNYTCARNNQLKNHIRTHTGERPFKCQYCSYAFARNSLLKNHIRTHTGEKPFKCQYCSYKCTINSNLKKHMKTHTGKKAYICEICEKKFIAKSVLKKHLRFHMG